MDDRLRTQAALDAVLSSLQHLRIDTQTIIPFEDANTVSGGYGDVYFATLSRTNPSHNVDVAVKALRQQGNNAERFKIAIRLARELKIWGNLYHPNLLQLIGYHLSHDMSTALLISPYMPHGHIEEYLKRTKPPLLKRLQLALDTAEGLKYLHELQPAICHGDLKSRNVLVSNDVRAVLCDFGLAKVIEESGMPSGLTTTKSLRGSTRYMSPELVEQDEPRHTLSSDIWAWGCVFIEITADMVPYSQAVSDTAVIRSLMQDLKPAPVRIDCLSDGLQSLLSSCWQRDCNSRPTAASLRETLRTFMPPSPSGEALNQTNPMADRHGSHLGWQGSMAHRPLEMTATSLSQRSYAEAEALPEGGPSTSLPTLPSLRGHEAHPQFPGINQQWAPNLEMKDVEEQCWKWDQFFWSAYHKWRPNRGGVVYPPHKIDGKEPDLSRLLLLVGSMGGMKKVDEMQLWSFVGGKVGFPYFGRPYPRSSPEVSQQLANVYKSSLADFEEHWYQALRPQDPTALLPLPKNLQHLHAAIEKFAIMPIAAPQSSQQQQQQQPQPGQQPQRNPTHSQTAAHAQHAVQQQQQLIGRTQPTGAGAPALTPQQQFQIQQVQRQRNMDLIRQQPQLIRMPLEDLRKMGWGEQQVETFDFHRKNLIAELQRKNIEQNGPTPAQIMQQNQNAMVTASQAAQLSMGPESQKGTPQMQQVNRPPSTTDNPQPMTDLRNGNAGQGQPQQQLESLMPPNLMATARGGFTQEQMESAQTTVQRLIASVRSINPLGPATAMALPDNEKTAIMSNAPQWHALATQAQNNLALSRLLAPAETRNLLMATAILSRLQDQFQLLQSDEQPKRFILNAHVLRQYSMFLQRFIVNAKSLQAEAEGRANGAIPSPSAGAEPAADGVREPYEPSTSDDFVTITSVPVPTPIHLIPTGSSSATDSSAHLARRIKNVFAESTTATSNEITAAYASERPPVQFNFRSELTADEQPLSARSDSGHPRLSKRDRPDEGQSQERDGPIPKRPRPFPSVRDEENIQGDAATNGSTNLSLDTHAGEFAGESASAQPPPDQPPPSLHNIGPGFNFGPLGLGFSQPPSEHRQALQRSLSYLDPIMSHAASSGAFNQASDDPFAYTEPPSISSLDLRYGMSSGPNIFTPLSMFSDQPSIAPLRTINNGGASQNAALTAPPAQTVSNTEDALDHSALIHTSPIPAHMNRHQSQSMASPREPGPRDTERRSSWDGGGGNMFGLQLAGPTISQVDSLSFEFGRSS